MGWLRQRLSELKRLPLMPGVHLSEEIEKLQARLKSLQHESRRHDAWVTVEIARHNGPAAHARLHRVPHRGLRGAQGRPPARRRPGHRRRPRLVPRPRRDGRRPPEGPDARRAGAPQLGHGQARGLPQGAAAVRPGRASRPARAHVRGHAGRLPGRRRRRGRPGARHRRDHAQDGAPQRAGHRHGHRRGRLGRSPGPRRRRPRAHAGERHVLGHHARGLRRDPLARRGLRAAGRRGAQADRVAPARPSTSSSASSPSRAAAPTTTPRPPRRASARPSPRRSPSSTASCLGSAAVSVASAFSSSASGPTRSFRRVRCRCFGGYSTGRSNEPVATPARCRAGQPSARRRSGVPRSDIGVRRRHAARHRRRAPPEALQGRRRRRRRELRRRAGRDLRPAGFERRRQDHVGRVPAGAAARRRRRPARARARPADPGARAAPPYRLAAPGVRAARPRTRVGGARPVLLDHSRRARLARSHGRSGVSATSARRPSTACREGSASACSWPWRWSTVRRSSFSTR